jgi:hypothetical protein
VNDAQRYFGILMHCGKQVVMAFGIANRIPCGLDTEISEENPEFWRRRISERALAKDIERNSGSGNTGTKYPGGPYPYDNDHTPEVFG